MCACFFFILMSYVLCIMFILTSVNQRLCTTLCIINHTLVPAKTGFGGHCQIIREPRITVNSPQHVRWLQALNDSSL